MGHKGLSHNHKCWGLVKPVNAENCPYVLIVRVEHEVNGKIVRETILAGGSPHAQNQVGPVKRLSSPYRGVSFHSCTQRWRGRIKSGKRSEHLGYFASDLDAAKAYNQAAREIHGEGAQLNDGVEEVFQGNPVLTSRLAEKREVAYGGPGYTEAKRVPKLKMVTRTSVEAAQQKMLQPQPSSPLSVHSYASDETLEAFDDMDALFDLEKYEPQQPQQPCNEWEDMFVQLWFDSSSEDHYDALSMEQSRKRSWEPSLDLSEKRFKVESC